MPLPAFVVPAAIAALSALFNRIGAGQAYGQKDRLMKALMAMLSPGNIGNEADQLFSTYQRSPMYTGLRTTAMNNASTLASGLQTSFARRGLSTSGIAGVAEPLARSSFANTFMGIDSDLFANALSTARQNILGRMDILKSGWQPSIGAQTTSGTLTALMPYLYEMLKKYMPAGPK
jgi:hypothetical protein